MFKIKGIVRGSYSQYQRFEDEFGKLNPVMCFEGKVLEDVLSGLVLPEWIYCLYVNGRKIVDPERYLKRKGVWKDCVRIA